MFIRSEGIATCSVGLYSHLNVWAYLRTSAHNTLKTIFVLLSRMLFVLIVLCSCSYGEIATVVFQLKCVCLFLHACVQLARVDIHVRFSRYSKQQCQETTEKL